MPGMGRGEHWMDSIYRLGPAAKGHQEHTCRHTKLSFLTHCDKGDVHHGELGGISGSGYQKGLL